MEICIDEKEKECEHNLMGKHLVRPRKEWGENVHMDLRGTCEMQEGNASESYRTTGF
jgi:hypothetical protein